MTEKLKRPRGRPVEKPLPEPIDDSPENVIRAVLATPPRNPRSLGRRAIRHRTERKRFPARPPPRPSPLDG